MVQVQFEVIPSERVRTGWMPGVAFTVGSQRFEYPPALLVDWVAWRYKAGDTPGSIRTLNGGSICVHADRTVEFGFLGLYEALAGIGAVVARVPYDSCVAAFNGLDRAVDAALAATGDALRLRRESAADKA